ncbi:MAG: DUF1553 domain-containing protein, partial [Fimbriiglobus sp.]|nr:DUF1553 domain-containing protein [Fimbriiglobus sp.]
WLLIERGKWGRKALLSFNLPELFGPRDEKQFRAFAALAGAESVLPAAGGTALLDTLDDSSHKHAFEVSTDLKYALRACIEEIGNEAIRYKREVAKEKVFDRNDIDLADQLSRECLRYMYRLLFLFYIEARPDLGYAPITAESYLKGYSLEHLRELEQMPLTTPEALDGTYFHESLKQLFTLIWEGFPKRGAQGGPQGEIQDELLAGGEQVLDTGFTIAPLQGHLFDPKQTPLLGSVKLRNRVLQKVIRLMSLSGERSGKTGRKGSSRGRISYGTLGINQLGAVYESLLSFRGFFAEDDLFEVRPDPKRKKDKPVTDDGDGAGDDADGGDDDTNTDDTTHFSRAIVQPLEAEQLLDAVASATGTEMKWPGYPRGTRAGQLAAVPLAGRRMAGGDGLRFLRMFGKPERLLTCECERSEDPGVLQAFQMLTGDLVNNLIRQPNNRLGKLLEAGKPDTELLDELYLSALSRTATTAEREKILAYVNLAKAKRDAWEDISWGLLNSKEFLLRR